MRPKLEPTVRDRVTEQDAEENDPEYKFFGSISCPWAFVLVFQSKGFVGLCGLNLFGIFLMVGRLVCAALPLVD